MEDHHHHGHEDHGSHSHGSNGSHEGHDHSGHGNMMDDFRKRFWISLVLSVPIVILSPLVQEIFSYSIPLPGMQYVSFILSVIVFFYGGSPFLKGLYSELKSKAPGMMTLIGLAITVAFVYSAAVVFGFPGRTFFWELATLIDVMLLGHWIEMRSVMGASRSLEKLAKLLPDTAHLMKGKEILDIRISEIAKGQRILVKPGERIPADGRVIAGEGYVDESMLTGESKPVRKRKGEKLVGGSINQDSSLEMIVEQTGSDSYLSKVMDLVRNAQAQKSRTQRLADRAALWLTLIAITSGILTFMGWWLINGDLAFAIERMATVMIITCPHALGLAIPLVVAISTAQSASSGLLIRNRTAFENSRKITAVVFDKTGTLTMGKFGVSGVKPEGGKNMLRIAASLESHSEHPIGKAIVDKAKESGLHLMKVSGFSAMKGEGISGKIGRKEYKVVGPGYLKKNGIGFPGEKGTAVYVLEGRKILGSITLEDSLRGSSFAAVERLRDSGIKCWMLTGDSEDAAGEAASKLHLDGYFSGVLPHEKQEKIRELQEKGEVVAMAGDGINDAPALAQADVGIAIGSGTDIAAETADIILVNSDPEDVPRLIEYGRSTYGKMVQNLFWATGYNAAAIPLAAGVLSGLGIIISPAIGAVFMSLSTIIVAANAKLLKLKKQ